MICKNSNVSTLPTDTKLIAFQILNYSQSSPPPSPCTFNVENAQCARIFLCRNIKQVDDAVTYKLYVAHCAHNIFVLLLAASFVFVSILNFRKWARYAISEMNKKKTLQRNEWVLLFGLVYMSLGVRGEYERKYVFPLHMVVTKPVLVDMFWYKASRQSGSHYMIK